MPPDLSALQPLLSRLVGAEHVAPGAAGEHVIDEVAPQLVVRPGSQDEVARVVEACASVGAALSCWGGGTAIGVGNPPTRLDVVLRLDRLARIVEFDDANLNVTAEAGVRLGALRDVLAAKRQFLPIDPPLAEDVTIGGLVASNASGPCRLQHGAVRDWVLGLRAVLTDGERIRCGGKVIKNVTGYDMNKLLIGSLGTLAVVTEVTFKTLPMPAMRATVLATFAELPQVSAVVARTLESFLLPESLEVLERGAMQAAAIPLAGGVGTAYGLVASVAGSEETMSRQVRDLTGLFTEGGAAAVVALRGEQATTLWRGIRDAPVSIGGRRDPRVVAKIAVPIGKTLDLFASAERLARRVGGMSAVTAHAGSGIVRAGYAAGGPLEALREGLETLRADAETVEGSLVLEAAPVALKRSMDAWGQPRQALSVMRRLKAEFDPRGVLSPGRFVGGI